MKLNKEICKRCMATGKYGVITFEWEKSDNEYWKKGKVHCPFSLNELDKRREGNLFSINRVPKDCRYKLEQTVMRQNGIK